MSKVVAVRLAKDGVPRHGVDLTMQPDQWRQLRTLFESARHLDQSEIEDFLSRQCEEDADLRRELRSLLQGREGDPLGDAVRAAVREVSSTDLPLGPEIGETVGKYRIVRLLGESGMGQVFVADDPDLHRQVALKLLPVWADATAAERFRREARTLATLKHRNVVTIHSVEHLDDRHYFTMEMLEGRTLADAIPAEGLALDEFFEIAIPLAEGLAAAHECGVIHRDLKPANVMLGSQREVKLVDFGLAKLRRSGGPDAGGAPSPTLTHTGVVMGTVPYMSPEQVEGRPLDPRSDVFSLGIVLYEMISGSRPFQGDSSAAVIASILDKDPPPVADLRRGLPPRLVRIIECCLEKDPDRRYQRAQDLARDLTAVDAAIRGHPKLSSAISGVAGLLPALRRSRWALPAAALFLGLVLAIAVPRSGPLRAPPAGATSEPPITGLAVLPLSEATNTAASEAYLKGLEAMTPDDRRHALEFFQDAVEADPEFALAHFQIANIHYLSGATGWAMPREATGKASAALSRALEIDPDLAEGHLLEGLIAYTFQWDWAIAERKLRRALELMPGSADAHLAIAGLMIDLGRFEEGLASLRRTQEIDPLPHRARRVLALSLYRARRFEEALAALGEQPESRGPGDFWTLSRIAHARGDHIGCVQNDLAWRRQVGHPKPLLEDLEAARAAGEPELYWRTLAEAYARSPKGLEPAHLIIDVYVRLGETERTLDWLEEAYAQRRPHLTHLGVDPLWDPLRSHLRFNDLLIRMNLPQALRPKDSS